MSNGGAAAARCAASADEPEKEGKKVAPASKLPYPAFVMDVRDESRAPHEVVGNMKTVIKEMLSLNVKGGTDSPLRLVLGFSTIPINELLAPQLLKGPSRSQGRAPMDLEGPSCSQGRAPMVLEDPSCNLGLLDFGSQSIMAESALALPSNDDHQLSDLTTRIKPWVRLVFIYDNVGREKSVVKRTLKTKAPGESWWLDALESLKPIPIPEILAQVLKTPERFTFVSWTRNMDYGGTLQQYLMSLCQESGIWRNPTRLLLHGLDPLAPPSRTLEAESQKRTWDAASDNPQHLRALCASIPLSGPSTFAPDTTGNSAPDTTTENSAAQLNWPPSPEANGLRSLLRGSASLLSEDQVAERANELLKILSTTLEENWRLKCAAEAAAARDAEEQVRLVRHTVLLALHSQ